MTCAADRALLSDWKAGTFTTREAHLIGHVGTIDHPDELAGFIANVKAANGWTDGIRVACVRRQIQISASLGAASRP